MPLAHNSTRRERFRSRRSKQSSIFSSFSNFFLILLAMTILPHEQRPNLIVQGLSSSSTTTATTTKPVQRIVLVGGGHAHAQVIRALNSKSRPKHLQVTLIDPQKDASYSGMVPGCIAKAYTPEQTLLHLEPLAEWADIDFINEKVVDMDLEQNCVFVENSGVPIPFDVCSIDIGSASRGVDETPGALQYSIPTRPISELVRRIEEAEDQITPDSQQHVVVIGGGAAGIELSMSIKGRWEPLTDNLKVTLLDSGTELLPSESPDCRQATIDVVKERGIQVRHGCHVEQITKDAVCLKNGDKIPYTHCIWAAGAAAHPLAWKLHKRGLAANKHGYIRVDRNLQSVSHPHVFAAGDCSSVEGLPGGPPPKAGVYAVRAGPVLIENLTRFLENKPLTKYKPQNDFLKLLVCGDGTALGFRFGMPLRGKWVFELKDAIDTSFMSLFARENLPELEEGQPYDISQYDAVKEPAKWDRLSPNEAAELLKRTDDEVNYRDAQQVLRDMNGDEKYRDEVLSQVKTNGAVSVVG